MRDNRYTSDISYGIGHPVHLFCNEDSCCDGLSKAPIFVGAISVPIAKLELCVARRGRLTSNLLNDAMFDAELDRVNVRATTAFIHDTVRNHTLPFCSNGALESDLSSGIRASRMSRTARTDHLQGPLDLVF